MKKMTSTLLMVFCGALLTSTMLFGQEISIQERVAIGVRAEPMEQQAARLEARAKMAAANVQEDGEPAANAKAENETTEESTAISNGYFYTSHPGAYHSPFGISYYGDSVELEDGSVWTVYHGDMYKVQNWIATDVLVITPNHTWFSAYNYKITNQSTGEAVVANMYLGPIYNSIYTHWILAIDYYYNNVYLEDGSVWSMSSFDSGTVSRWMVNDTVIIGVNDGWLSSSRPNILINVNMLNHASGMASF